MSDFLVSASDPRFEVTLTDKYQNTVPAGVRRLLGLKKRDKIAYVVRDGQVVVEKVVDASEENEDPAVLAFLNFLEKDMIKHPESLSAFGGHLVDEAEALVAGIEVDLDAPLDDEE
jgi:antitoxin PrlF